MLRLLLGRVPECLTVWHGKGVYMNRGKKIWIFVLLFIFCAGHSIAESKFTYKPIPSTGSLKIESNPSSALVYVDGTYYGITPIQINGLYNGTHSVKIQKAYYKDWTGTYMVKAGHVNTITAYLTKEPTTGDLTVRANVSNARVYVNGSYKGYAPVTMNNLKPDHYRIKVERDNYKSYETTVYIMAGEQETVDATLYETKVEVSVTNITDASIYLDGIYKGHAPITISDVSPGYHTVRASKGRYPDTSYNFYAAEGTTTRVSLTMQTASLYVSSSPSGASLYLDGMYKGTTPITIQNLEPGNCRIELRKTHYASVSETKYLSVGTILNCTAEMTKISGYLSVSKSPSNASITVGGENYSGTMELDEGTYTVKGSCFGYKPLSKTVSISRNKSHSISMDLEKAPFDITSFGVEESKITPGKKGSTLKVKQNVTGPETGTISISDSQGSVLTSWNTTFSTWQQYTEWDGFVEGNPIPSGTYTVTLSAGGKQRSATFTAESDEKTLAQKLEAAKPLSLLDADEEAKKEARAEKFMERQDGRSGIFISGGVQFNGFDVEPVVDLSLLFTLPSPFFFAGFKGEGSMSPYGDPHGVYYELALVKPDARLIGTFYNADAMATLGATITLFGWLRPYVMLGAGYYMSFYPADSVLYEEDPRYGSGGILSQGFCAEMEAGLDIKIKRFSIGAAYRLHFDLGAGARDCILVSLGWRFW